MAKLICLLCQRALARRAALGVPPAPDTWLAAHLDRCAACAQAWDQLLALTSRLPQILSAPQPSPGFTLSVAARMARRAGRPAGARLFSMALPVAAALALVIGFRMQASAPGSRPIVAPGVADSLPPPVLVGPEGVPLVATPPAPPSGFGPAGADPSPVLRVSYSPAEPVRAPRRVPVARRTAGFRPRPRRVAGPGPRDWATWGTLSEASGEHGLAAVAYRRAFEREPTAALGLAAGRSAERAGDVAGALDLYAQLLEMRR
jgi:hypothetical protein